MILFRSILFSSALYSWTLLLGIICLPALLLPDCIVMMVANIWTRGCIALAQYICGINWVVKGKENIGKGAVIYAAKHQSAWETLAFWLILDRPLYVLKRELLWLPLVGWFLRKIGNIAIDRGAGVGAMRDMINRAVSALNRGHCIVIFPEGTRVALHETKPFSSGIAVLYSQANVPVIPIALNSGKCWGRNSFIKIPGTITVEILPAIPPGIPSREFLDGLEKTLNEATKRLEQL